MIVLDTSIVTMALPTVAAALGMSARQLSWVANGYMVSFGGFLLLGGRLADAIGPRLMFLLGLTVFGVSSLVGGLATSAGGLISARVVQGLGGAILSPAGLAILTRLFPGGAARNRALGLWAAVAAAGAPAGAIIGGVLTETVGWAAVLLVNVPLCALGLAVSVRALPAFGIARAREPFDVAGAATATAGLAALVYALVDAGDSGWTSARTVSLLGVACALLAAFVPIEMRARNPVLPLELFRREGVAGANLVAFAGGMPQYGMAFCLTLYLQDVLGFNALAAGLAFLPFGALSIPSARVASRVVTRWGYKPAMIFGAATIALGLLPLATVPASDGYVRRVLPALLLLAVGISVLVVATNVAALSRSSGTDAGVTAGLVATSQQLGEALGLGLTVAVLDATTRASTLLGGMRAAFAFDAGITAGAVLLAATAVSSRGSRSYARTRKKATTDPPP